MKLTDAIEYMTEAIGIDSRREPDAARVVAVALLDPTPVTGEALVAMGWERSFVLPKSGNPRDEDCIFTSPASTRDEHESYLTWEPQWGIDSWCVEAKSVAALFTLGQVRCACLAFGIPMREES